MVFGVGFVVGLGATYTLLARTPSADPAPPAAAAPAAVLSDTDSTTVVSDKTPSLDDPTLTVDGEKNVTAQPPIPSRQLDADLPEAVPAPTMDEPAVDTAAANKQAQATAPVEDAAEPQAVDKPSEPKWWEGLVGTRCDIDLGRARALTIRKGTVKDGATTDWSTAYGGNPRIGLINAADKNIVTVHGVAVSEQGTPIAAEVSLDRKGKITRGVIALHTQGLRVSLRKIDAP